MPAWMKIGDIKGEATEQNHADWVLIESMSAPIHRSIPEGARDNQRTRGETTLGDIHVVRELDKSSPKLSEACANGTFFPEVEVHFASTTKNKQNVYLKYLMKNVIVTSYNFHGNRSGSPLPSEDVTMGFTEVEWTYTILDKDTGEPKGNVAGKYNPNIGMS